MKKVISLFLVTIICIMSFSSCSGPARVKVNGTKIDNEVYAYFEDMYDEDEVKTKNAISRYVTINSEFNNRNLTLIPAQKSSLSTKVDALWHLYGNHYEKLGVSKATIYKIEASKFYEDALLDYYYGEGGVEPVSEDELKKYFKSHYVAISYATEYLFNVDEAGEMVPMTDNEKAAIINGFANAEGLVNTGTPIEGATSKDVNQAIINSSSDTTFPAGFFKEVANIKVGAASTVVLDDYAFLVQRIDVFDKTYNYYDSYRTQCLRELKGKAFDQMIDRWSQSYKVK